MLDNKNYQDLITNFIYQNKKQGSNSFMNGEISDESLSLSKSYNNKTNKKENNILNNIDYKNNKLENIIKEDNSLQISLNGLSQIDYNSNTNVKSNLALQDVSLSTNSNLLIDNYNYKNNINNNINAYTPSICNYYNKSNEPTPFSDKKMSDGLNINNIKKVNLNLIYNNMNINDNCIKDNNNNKLSLFYNEDSSNNKSNKKSLIKYTKAQLYNSNNIVPNKSLNNPIEGDQYNNKMLTIEKSENIQINSVNKDNGDTSSNDYQLTSIYNDNSNNNKNNTINILFKNNKLSKNNSLNNILHNEDNQSRNNIQLNDKYRSSSTEKDCLLRQKLKKINVAKKCNCNTVLTPINFKINSTNDNLNKYNTIGNDKYNNIRLRNNKTLCNCKKGITTIDFLNNIKKQNSISHNKMSFINSKVNEDDNRNNIIHNKIKTQINIQSVLCNFKPYSNLNDISNNKLYSINKDSKVKLNKDVSNTISNNFPYSNTNTTISSNKNMHKVITNFSFYKKKNCYNNYFIIDDKNHSKLSNSQFSSYGSGTNDKNCDGGINIKLGKGKKISIISYKLKELNGDNGSVIEEDDII